MSEERVELQFELDGNARCVESAPKRSALDLLREELGAKSLRPGCSPQGICGSCAAVVGDKVRLTCTLPAKALGGKVVRTLAGIPTARVVAEAFVDSGAVRCGACIPGLVTQAATLLDFVPDPDDAVISKALQLHLCRCTGWESVRAAIKLAAARLRDEEAAAPDRDEALVALALGQVTTVEDMRRPGMLHGAIVWAPQTAGEILAVELEAARAAPGVHLVLGATEAGAAGLLGTGDQARCAGAVVALIAADTREAAQAAADQVVVRMAPAPPAPSLAELVKGEPTCTRMAETGEVEAALAAASHVVELQLEGESTDAAFLEPEAALAVPDGEGGIEIWTNAEVVASERWAVAAALACAPERVRVRLLPSGGAFGMRNLPLVSPWAARLAVGTGRPVKLGLDMEEAVVLRPKRPAAQVNLRLGASAGGLLVGIDAEIEIDLGGRSQDPEALLEAVIAQIGSAYRIPARRVRARGWTSARPATSTGRGAVHPLTTAAVERAIDQLARSLEMSPGALRRSNAVPEALAAMEALGEEEGVVLGTLTTHPAVARVELEVAGPAELLLRLPVGDTGDGLVPALRASVAQITGLPQELIGLRGLDADPASQPALMVATTRAARALARALSEVKQLASLVGHRFAGEGESDGATYATAQVARLDGGGALLEIRAALSARPCSSQRSFEVEVQGGLHLGVGLALSEGLPMDETGWPDMRFRSLGVLKEKSSPRLEVRAADQGPTLPDALAAELACRATPAAIAAAITAQGGEPGHALPMREGATARTAGVRPVKGIKRAKKA